MSPRARVLAVAVVIATAIPAGSASASAADVPLYPDFCIDRGCDPIGAVCFCDLDGLGTDLDTPEEIWASVGGAAVGALLSIAGGAIAGTAALFFVTGGVIPTGASGFLPGVLIGAVATGATILPATITGAVIAAFLVDVDYVDPYAAYDEEPIELDPPP